MSRKIVQIGYLVPRDAEVLERFDQIISELTGRGVVSSTGYCYCGFPTVKEVVFRGADGYAAASGRSA